MSKIICYKCKSIITGNIFRAYDQSFCSDYCRYNLVGNCDYNDKYIMVNKQTLPIKNNPSFNSIKPEDPATFDFSTIDIHYASYNYTQDIIHQVYHNTKARKQYTSFVSYVTKIFYEILGML